MAGNSGLSNATKAKKDEFYTRLTDIEKEMRYYRAHFKGKTVFCNCDDPFESNFFKYFVLNFNKLGLKKLIATCYATSPIANQQLTLFDVIGGEEENRDKPYKAVVTKVYDKTGDGGVDMFDVAELFKSGENELTELAGDGDFRSKECLELLDEADIVVTNPPFSLFRNYVAMLMEHKKKFIIIGNQNAITYKEIFPLLMNNEIWLGNGFSGNVGFFSSPYDDIAASSQHKEGLIRVSGVVWFTNLDIKKRHEELILVKRYSPDIYLHYDNYDAINVNKTVEIPCDYSGVMGVPITFLDKYSPDQFEILGVTQSWCGVASKIYPKQVQIDKNGKRSQVTKLNDGAAIKVEVPPKGKTYYDVDGELFVKTYARVLVRNKHPEAPREV
ncbi:adenine-specific methyltransferase EcoRI family protein [Gardnerella vaginalis]|uniref:adenine-specific methyltransferase EcoRI family protein n=1 Tax=Gardnerella TaxID=2701 RepID=UPI00200D6DD0|nr:adenine-specific methyltransferase EcoRI family protein [Gardnerella vaginalis]UQA80235.1 adenine-specific methyltransferase EcoRI family protein [Gardnerella vaginalis]